MIATMWWRIIIKIPRLFGLLVRGNHLLAVCPEVGVEYYTTEHHVTPRCVLRMIDLSPCLAEPEQLTQHSWTAWISTKGAG